MTNDIQMGLKRFALKIVEYLNLSTIRKFTLQILSYQKDRLSLKKRQYKAALDLCYLKKIINF